MLTRAVLMRRRSQRGAALLTIVLAAVAIASIVGAGAMLVVSVMRGVSAETRLDTTRAQSQAVLAEIEAKLAVDPQFFLDEVYQLTDDSGNVVAVERTRVCLTNSLAYEAGEDWPFDTCGGQWDYISPTQSAASRVEFVPPGPNDSTLTVRILTGDGVVDAGYVVSYLQRSAASTTVHTDGDVDLTRIEALDSDQSPTVECPSGTPSSGVCVEDMSVYSAGQITLDNRTKTLYRSGAFAAEEGFTAPLPPVGDSNRFFSSVPPNEDVADIREVSPTVQRSGNLRAAVGQLAAVGCPEDITPSNHVDRRRTRSLCLRAGEELVDAEDNQVTVPAGVTGWRLQTDTYSGSEPQLAGVPVINVSYSTTVPTYAATTCTVPCNVLSGADSLIAAGTHPGADSHWTEFGEFLLPLTGVVATGADTHVGMCGEQFNDPNGQLDDCNQMEVTGPVTVVAGTVASPADVYLSGPIVNVDAGRIGLVASADIIVPYWARKPAGDLQVDANLVALGAGAQVGRRGWNGEVRSFPVEVDTANSNNIGRQLKLTGSVASVDLDMAFITDNGGPWQQVLLLPDTDAAFAPPPYFPSFSSTWRVAQRRFLTGQEVCGDRLCAGF